MTKFFAAAAIVAFGFAGQAVAADQPRAEANKVVVSGSVNFRDQGAVQGYYNRLARAAAQACDSNSANSRIQQADRACDQKALTMAVAQVNRPILTAMHESATGGNGQAYANRN